MGLDEAALTASYLEHLSDEDLAFLCAPRAAGESSRGDYRRVVRARRGGIEGFLGDREVFDALFLAERGAPLLGVSPFLAFAVAVRRVASELGSTRYVSEWVSRGRRAPVFDVARLAEFVSGPWRRLFLAELLASYSRVASGSVLVATSRGLRRQRFSELDPVRMAGLLEVVAPAERPGVLRRLGDLALFLTGVFPDYVARHGFGPVDQARLLRAGRPAANRTGPRQGSAPKPAKVEDSDAVTLLCRLGRRWYQVASQLLGGQVPANVAVIGELPERFDDARHVLGVIADRFLFPHRDDWFTVRSG
ncbi:MAG: hypothetical protein ACRDZX_00120 [Acidimicrobiales bacterium]